MSCICLGSVHTLWHSPSTRLLTHIVAFVTLRAKRHAVSACKVASIYIHIFSIVSFLDKYFTPCSSQCTGSLPQLQIVNNAKLRLYVRSCLNQVTIIPLSQAESRALGSAAGVRYVTYLNIVNNFVFRLYGTLHYVLKPVLKIEFSSYFKNIN